MTLDASDRHPRSRIVRTLVAALILASASPAAAQVIVGRVVDDSTGSAVARARVTAAGEDRNGLRRTLTGDDGRFTLAVRGGGYRVRVARTGYGDARSEVVTVGPGDTARVTLRVTPVPRRLAGVTATARPRRPPLDGVYTPVTATDSLLALPIRAEGGSGRVIVNGQMVLPTDCYRLAGVAEHLGSVLTLFLDARPSGDPCPPGAVGASRYKVIVRRIPAGTYTLRIVHTYRDEVWPSRMALDTTVTVQR
jgi:hypothetical protein